MNTLVGTLSSPSAVEAAPASTRWYANRWVQLVLGIVCMSMIANLQYGWTLFVDPMSKAHGWGRAAIQIAFTIFILTETWLVPIEGWIVDSIGPRKMVFVGGALCAIAWVINSRADSLAMLYLGAVDRRHRCRLRLRHLHRQRAEVVPRQARPGRRPHRRRLRRRLGADHHPDRQHDQGRRLPGRVLQLRPRSRAWW